MIRLLLLIAILGALTLFAVQNLAPVSLVILGIPTVAFPLSFWVLGAIGAGVLTTILMAGLIEVSRPVSRPASQPKSRPIGDRFSNFRTGGWSAASTEAAKSTARRSAARDEDWDSDRDSAAWENWDEPSPRSTPPQTPNPAQQPPIRDREDAAWSDWQGYEESPRRQPPPDAEPIPYRENRPPINFEADQRPTSRSQSGSVYSYSYRPPEEPEDDPIEDEPPPARSNSVYDAEFRVITPPFRPAPEETPPPPRAADPAPDDEWDFVDDDGDWDRKR
ncbi:hypothetical protein [Leptolyngbya ohadii]|uniref:hypothetical protein n=1 Tax=Leptolyngbya ohadii TaxID=1962290 RepID=UPI000B59EB1E|nr:hypothetical protein [Leptolyngbya ohadii]